MFTLSFGKGTCFNGAYHAFTQDMLSGPLKSRNLEGKKKKTPLSLAVCFLEWAVSFYLKGP